jgi:hypothetical protein
MGVTANSTWKFWVVTWLDQNGQLLDEISCNGLNSLPQQSAPYNSPADVPIEPTQTIFGFYNQTFLVAGRTNVSSIGTAKARQRLIVSDLELSNSDKALRDRPITIVAKLRSTGADISADAYYHDGNPAKDGILSDVQQIDKIHPATVIWIMQALLKEPAACIGSTLAQFLRRLHSTCKNAQRH